MATVEDPVPISEPRKPLPSNFRPALVVGLDGRRFVAKGLQRHRTDEPLGRRLFADQVVGRLGVAMGAPVADVTLLHLSKDIADSNVATMHLDPGTLHGSIFRDDLEPGWGDIEFLNEAENRQRFAQLAVLFGWMHADDQQFMYHRTPPHLVVSVTSSTEPQRGTPARSPTLHRRFQIPTSWTAPTSHQTISLALSCC